MLRDFNRGCIKANAAGARLTYSVHTVPVQGGARWASKHALPRHTGLLFSYIPCRPCVQYSRAEPFDIQYQEVFFVFSCRPCIQYRGSTQGADPEHASREWQAAGGCCIRACVVCVCCMTLFCLGVYNT